MIYIKGKVTIDGYVIDSLAKKFNTPLYCYSYKKLKNNILNFKRQFKKIDPLICFSVKSNSNTKLNAAIPTTNKENKIPVVLFPNNGPINETPNRDKTIFNIYTMKMPNVAENMPNLKLSVTAIILLL